jgi:hypothetical protein
MSWSNHPDGSGCEVTVKTTGLLQFMLGAMATVRYPEFAPVEIVMLIEVSLQELMVIAASLRSTALLPCVAPNPLPLIVTLLPTDPVVVESPVMTGGVVVDVVTDTLSNVAV